MRFSPRLTRGRRRRSGWLSWPASSSSSQARPRAHPAPAAQLSARRPPRPGIRWPRPTSRGPTSASWSRARPTWIGSTRWASISASRSTRTRTGRCGRTPSSPPPSATTSPGSASGPARSCRRRSTQRRRRPRWRPRRARRCARSAWRRRKTHAGAPAGGGRGRDAQDHARRLLPELVRHLAVGRGEVERGPGERLGAARQPRLPDDRQQPLRRVRRLDDGRLLGQPGRRRVRAEHGRLPGAGRHLLHRRREHLRARVPDEHEPAARRRRVPLPLPPDQAGPQGQRRDRAAPADHRSRSRRTTAPSRRGRRRRSSTRLRPTRGASSTTSSRATRRPRTGRR